MLDGHEIGQVFIDDRSYKVKLVSTTNPINDPTDLENIFLKTTDGRFVPVSTIATLTEVAVPPSLSREQQMRAVVDHLGPGARLRARLGADAGRRDRRRRCCRPAAASSRSPKPRRSAKATARMLTIFGFAIVIILLVLAAQFESFVSAIIIMATVPLGLACAVFALIFTGTSLNAYSQIGLVLLVGVMAKNGILIVEFANQLRDRGMGVREAIEQASNIRLRPVMMTMICTVLGGLPLVLASGAGAEARIALGWVIVGGLGMATRLDAVPDAGRLSAARPLRHAEGRGGKAAEARARGSRKRRSAITNGGRIGVRPNRPADPRSTIWLPRNSGSRQRRRRSAWPARPRSVRQAARSTGWRRRARSARRATRSGRRNG